MWTPKRIWQWILDQLTTPIRSDIVSQPALDSRILAGTSLSPHPEVVARAMGDDVFLVHLVRGTVFRLNHTGLMAWDLLGTSQSVPEIIEQVAAVYGVEPCRVEPDIHALLGELLRNGLLELPVESPCCESSLNCR